MSVSPHPELVQTLLALSLVTLASLVGSISFALGRRLEAFIPYLVSAAAGALLATALFHLLPEALEHSTSTKKIGALLMGGLLISFLLERSLGFYQQWRSADLTLSASILVSGALHSLVDGIGIAAAFSLNHEIGVLTTAAVLLHEVPHHIADVGVLIYSGIGKRRAILLNLIATLGCAVGGLLVLLFGSRADLLVPTLLPLTAANFLYISVGLLMPELQREKNRKSVILQTATLVVTAVVVACWGQTVPETLRYFSDLTR